MNKEVESILGHQQNPQTKSNIYYIKWKGLSYSDCTWESQNNINKFKNILDKYKKQHIPSTNVKKTGKNNQYSEYNQYGGINKSNYEDNYNGLQSTNQYQPLNIISNQINPVEQQPVQQNDQTTTKKTLKKAKISRVNFWTTENNTSFFNVTFGKQKKWVSRDSIIEEGAITKLIEFYERNMQV